MSLSNLSIVVPTMNEAANIGPLLSALANHVPGCQVLFVDDTTDRSTINSIESERIVVGNKLRVDYVHRTGAMRTGGLAGAVMDGYHRAAHDLVLVMDADLQHPAQTIPDLLYAAERSDIVVGSRYCEGGDPGGLDGALRLMVSKVSTHAAKLLFPHALREVSDPMAGFYLVNRSCLELDSMAPTGFKILLEVLVRHPHLSRQEVPIRMAKRKHGCSKGSFKQGKLYLQHLLRLRRARPATQRHIAVTTTSD